MIIILTLINIIYIMNNSTTTIVGAIILAGVLIAGAVIYTKKPTSVEPQTAGVEGALRPENKITYNGHFIGNPDAGITLTNYFDINCGHCINFHKTMEALIEKHGKDGKLRWISKHFALNPVSAKEAEAVECATEIGGEEMYWKFLEKLMTTPMPTQNKVISEMIETAEELKINKDEFKTCLESGKYISSIEMSGQEAVSLGARGTPFSVIETRSGEKQIIPGALPFEEIEKIIEGLLNEN